MDRKLIVEIRTRLAKAKPKTLKAGSFAAELAERYGEIEADIENIIKEEAAAKGVKV